MLRSEVTLEIKKDIIYMYTKEMKSTLEIGEKYNIRKSEIRIILINEGIKLRKNSKANRIYSFNSHYFDNFSTPNQAYILGLLYADGNNSLKYNRIKLSLIEKDKDVLEKISKELKNEKPLLIEYREKYDPMYTLVLYNHYLCVRLNNLGMVPCKSLTLQFPEWMDESLYSHFIRGYFDGDGCISKTGRGAKCNIVSSYDFCIYLSKFLEEKLDIYSVVYHAENPQTGRLFINRKDDTKKFVDYMYKNADLYMNRKHDIYIKKFYSEKT